MQRASTPRWRGAGVELFLLKPDQVTDAYVNWLNDAQVNRYLESRFAVADLDSTRQFVANALAGVATLFLGIRSRSLNRHVGNIKLGPIDRHHGLGEIGILVGDRAAWGQGVATEAISLLIHIAHEELGLRKLTAGCYASNVGSVRAFIKAGFVVEGRRAAHFILDGRPEDLVLLARTLHPDLPRP
jgi:RimJ/RimL family protein N-acetyltransferase